MPELCLRACALLPTAVFSISAHAKSITTLASVLLSISSFLTTRPARTGSAEHGYTALRFRLAW